MRQICFSANICVNKSKNRHSSQAQLSGEFMVILTIAIAPFHVLYCYPEALTNRLYTIMTK